MRKFESFFLRKYFNDYLFQKKKSKFKKPLNFFLKNFKFFSIFFQNFVKCKTKFKCVCKKINNLSIKGSKMFMMIKTL